MGSHPIRLKSPSNHFPLSELLFVPLIILYGTEKSHVKPRLSASLRLSRLKQLSGSLPCALETVVSLLGAMRRIEIVKKKLVKREAHTPETLGAWERC